MAEITVVDVPGVEIMAVGVWNGERFEVEDLDAIVEAFDETRATHPPRVQLGHDLKQRYARKLFGDDHEGADGFPALGWPVRLWRDGKRLMSNLSHVPTALTDLVANGSYLDRSVALAKNVKIGGKTYRWLLHHVAILGDDPPAVKGMAPIQLSDALTAAGGTLFAFSVPARPHDSTFAAGAAADEPRPMTPDEIAAEIEAIDEVIGALQDRVNRLTYKRQGNPPINMAFRRLREDIRRTVKLSAGDDPMPAPITPSTDLADDPAAPVAGGGGTNIVSADVLAAMLAVLTNKSPDDYSGIFSAVKSALGAAPAESGDADPLAGDGATLADGGTVIPELKPDAVDPQTLAVFTAMRNEFAALKSEHLTDRAKLAAFEVKAKRDAAETKADAAINARALPATVRDALVAFAEAGRDDLFDQVVGAAREVPVHERGTSEGAPAPAVTLSASDRAIMAVTGVSEAAMIAQKAKDAGLPAPAQAAA